jgi:hypothetical protein
VSERCSHTLAGSQRTIAPTCCSQEKTAEEGRKFCQCAVLLQRWPWDSDEAGGAEDK